jgi:hypothetical protein
MGSKTPVSILQEMCIRKGRPPQYELVHDGGLTHEALFKFKVSVGETSGIFMLLLGNCHVMLSRFVNLKSLHSSVSMPSECNSLLHCGDLLV